MCATKKDPYQEVTDSLKAEENPLVGSQVDSATSETFGPEKTTHVDDFENRVKQ